MSDTMAQWERIQALLDQARKDRKEIPEALRCFVINERKEGLSIDAIARISGVPRSTVYYWIRSAEVSSTLDKFRLKPGPKAQEVDA